MIYDFEYVPLPDDRDLERRFLLEERMQVGLPKDHPLAGRKKIRLDQLADANWIVGTCAASCRDNAILACQQAGFDPRFGFESDDYQVHQSLVSAGMGVSLLPELLLTGRHPGLSVVDIEPSPPVRRVWALTRSEGARAPATEAMLEILEREAKRLSRPAAR
ncbi:MAG: LysR substrate-binding domain-containing protein [Actinomycetota bacterium]